MRKIFTLADARREKEISDLRMHEKYERIDAEKNRISKILADNPQIGRLSSGKFYTFPAGGVYREHRDPAALV